MNGDVSSTILDGAQPTRPDLPRPSPSDSLTVDFAR
jgi:hypothetical protein